MEKQGLEVFLLSLSFEPAKPVVKAPRAVVSSKRRFNNVEPIPVFEEAAEEPENKTS